MISPCQSKPLSELKSKRIHGSSSFETDMTRGFLREVGEEVVKAAAFLVSDEASYITGICEGCQLGW